MKKILRFAAWTLGVVVALVLVAGGALYAYTQHRFDKKWQVAGHQLTIPTDTLSIARGRHIATAMSKCADCHGEDFGGKLFIDVPPLGRLYSANLTRGKGGVGGQLSDLDWERAIRHGVKPDGSILYFMPAEEFTSLDDEDTAALIAYLKTLQPVDRVPGSNFVGPIGRALYAKGDLPLVPAEMIDQTASHPARVPEGETVEYGRYIANIGGCKGCHGDGLAGGPIPGAPPGWKPASNITPAGIGHYTEQDFFTALRDGKRPGGTPIDTLMPVKYTKLMTDVEIRALYMYLKTVPSKPYGQR